ncbi:OLC1v1017016C1 [Oldenlandia corymbosa var. corymbosa]|uniref:OLC1v1017016C1 n=1 Tax=Oldenlandia corymbosa var. corymbosa TaxID=529605 RepID=A0AAV1E8I0_OLDCO|nr:OLC1v1017016C1 [Oldenlandia corymbosa var. corymbosa]
MSLMSGSQAPGGGGAVAAAVSCTHRCSLKFINPIPPLFSSHRRPPKFQSTSISNNVHKPLTVANAEPTSQTTSTSSPSGANSSGPNLNNSPPITLKGQGDVPLEGVIQFEKPSSSTAALISKWGRVALLSGGDVLALILFSAIGRFSHGFVVFDLETLKTADPFIAGWFLGAYFLGGFGKDGRGMNGRNKAITAAAKSWALGIPLGIIIRSIALGHIPATNFVIVTMGSTAVLLIGWRALVSSIIAEEKSTNDDSYRRGSPFELFELLTSLVRRW